MCEFFFIQECKQQQYKSGLLVKMKGVGNFKKNTVVEFPQLLEPLLIPSKSVNWDVSYHFISDCFSPFSISDKVGTLFKLIAEFSGICGTVLGTQCPAGARCFL